MKRGKRQCGRKTGRAKHFHKVFLYLTKIGSLWEIQQIDVHLKRAVNTIYSAVLFKNTLTFSQLLSLLINSLWIMPYAYVLGKKNVFKI